jgi:hypothetical protein
MVRDARAKLAVILVPDVVPHDDPARVIGRRTSYHRTEMLFLRGEEVVVVAILKDALLGDDHGYLTTEEEVRAAGGVGPFDRVEVAPWMPKAERLSFATSDPRAVDLEAFWPLRAS